VNLEARIGGITLATPLIGASGLFGYGDEYKGLVDFAAMGAVITKTITPEPREGNPPPRLIDLDCGILNSIGLENIGLRAFKRSRLPQVDIPCKLIVSIGGATVDGYARMAAELDGLERVEGIEVNISCPNVKEGGMAFGSDPESTRRVVEAVRRKTGLTLLVKVPPLIWGIEEVCRSAIEAGADALAVANTYPAMAIDPLCGRPLLGAATGGLSGRAIKPISLLLVWRAAKAFDVPVVGGGGIEQPEDAVEYMLAGACALQIGSVIFKDFKAPSRILDGVREHMKRKGYKSLDDFRGRSA
jgi:dihydroorotate dehydrogenase (NAD+) catalytic subunit